MNAVTVYHRIADHAAALARLEASCDPADELAAKNRGEAVTPEAEAEHVAALEAEALAFEELLAFVPVNTVEHSRKIGYLQFILQAQDTLDRDQLGVLLHSLRLYRPRAVA